MISENTSTIKFVSEWPHLGCKGTFSYYVIIEWQMRIFFFYFIKVIQNLDKGGGGKNWQKIDVIYEHSLNNKE